MIGSGKQQLILASQSPRRRELLTRLGLPFESVPADVEELESQDMNPVDLAQENARLKAGNVAEKFSGAWVIGSDTVVAIGNRSLGKPGCREEAIGMIRTLAGRIHQVYTAVCLVCRAQDVSEQWYEKSEVRFFPLEEREIRTYVDQTRPYDFAGGYPVQHELGGLVAGFSGSYSNIVGLPMMRLKQTLLEHGVIR